MAGKAFLRFMRLSLREIAEENKPARPEQPVAETAFLRFKSLSLLWHHLRLQQDEVFALCRTNHVVKCLAEVTRQRAPYVHVLIYAFCHA